MKMQHYLGMALLVVVGYYLGMKFPSWGSSLGL